MARSIGFPILFLCIVLAVLLAGGTKASAGETRPNIIFIYTDDHACQAVSAYGSQINTTPNIDRLAKQGMRFNRCYVPNSICGPCRATVLTGKYSHENGFYVNGPYHFNGSQQTFPKLLQQAGYQTAIIGKWHLKSEPTGFDHWEVLIGQGLYYNSPMIRNGRRIEHKGYTTEVITDLALQWLQEKREPSEPFLLMYQHKAPHRNWDPGPKHLNLYDDIDIPEPPTLFEDYAKRGVPARQQDMTIAETLDDRDLKLEGPDNLTPDQQAAWDAAYGPKNDGFQAANLRGKELTRWKYQRYVKDYLRCVASVDDQVGRLLDYLNESGLAENTIVVYSSDQGFYLGEHGWFDKRWMYEESLRTPLIVRWPGVVAENRVNEDIVSPLDFASTFLEIAGAEIPSDLQGRSLVPLLEGKPPTEWRDSFYYHYYEYPGYHYVRRHYGVTDGRYKLIYFYEPDVDEWELYDLFVDRGELVNLYDDPEYKSVKTRLMGELERLRTELRVPDQDPLESQIPTPPPRSREPTQ